MKRSHSVLVLNNNNKNILEIINDNENNKKEFCDFTYSKLKHKIFLEKILHIIKITQIEFLSQISTSKRKKFYYKIIKNLLLNLKNELETTFNDNVENMKQMENRKNKNKLLLVNNIFGKFHKSNNLINQNTTSNINRIYNAELPHLKLLNFKIENQLRSMKIKIKLISPSLFSIKNTSKFIYLFLDGKNDTSNAYNYLHDNLISIRDRFKLIVKQKEFQNAKILQMNAAVNLMKEECRLKFKKNHNEYINTSQVINEESKEYNTKTGAYTIEKINFNHNHKQKLKEYEDFEDKDIYKNKLVNIKGKNS